MSFFAVPAKAILEGSLFTGKEEARYYLKGVFVCQDNDGAARLVATDGVKAIVIMSDTAKVPDDESIIINTSEKALITALKAQKLDLNSKWLVVDKENSVGHVVYANSAIRAIETATDSKDPHYIQRFERCLIDAPYPDWKRIFPKEVSPTYKSANGINASFLALFGKLSPTGIVKVLESENSAHIVLMCGRDDAVGVVGSAKMAESSLPDWL